MFSRHHEPEIRYESSTSLFAPAVHDAADRIRRAITPS
jgi:hypothetical protein